MKKKVKTIDICDMSKKYKSNGSSKKPIRLPRPRQCPLSLRGAICEISDPRIVEASMDAQITL